MSAIPVFIPYVNRPDLLDRVLSMIPRRMITEPVVINNSGSPLTIGCKVMEPPVPLTFVQSQNWMLKEAKFRKVPFYMWGHCDAVLQPDTVELLYEQALKLFTDGIKWGVLYTHYDIFCAYSTNAVDAIGGYDTLWMDYTSDQDFYRRMDLAGYLRLESHLPVGHDKGSTTIKSDPEYSRRVGLQVQYRSEVYRQKWGGEPGRETFTVPWGGK